MKQEIKVMIVTAKVLQFCADIFAVFGIFMFAYIYFQHFKDSPSTAVLKDPLFIVTILVPFVPAAVLAWQASRKRKQIRALLEQPPKSS